MPIHQIKCGMKVEIRNKEDPASVWIATVRTLEIFFLFLCRFFSPAIVKNKKICKYS